MSKISLEPNDSGAGTFSIVSPDSNTNRTLNLPDEAGKLLSTGNDDPAEVFKQSNILGTVSESGGVPTGAIIERGSNSNGEFIKYADGTMICFVSLSYATTDSNLQNEDYTFPATFDAIPNFQVTIQDNRDAILGGANRDIVSNVSESLPRVGSGRIRAWAVDGFSFNSGHTWKIGVMLFGRWY